MFILRHVLLLLALSLSAVTAANPHHFAYACFNCGDGQPGANHFIARMFLTRMEDRFAGMPDVKTSLFDIGPGTTEGVVARYDDIVRNNFTMLFLSLSIPDDKSTIEMLTRVHNVNPNFHAMILDNQWPESTNIPWLASVGMRMDQMGFMAGFISGTITRTGRVAVLPNTAQWWGSKAIAASFNVGVRDACPHCIVDVQHVSDLFSPYMPDTYVQRGADVITAMGVTSGEHFVRYNLERYKNVTFNFLISDMRDQFTDDQQAYLPYGIEFDLYTGPIEQMSRLVRGEPFQSGLYLSSVAGGSMPLVGCLKRGEHDHVTTPCGSTGIPPVLHSIIHQKYTQLGTREQDTGIIPNDDAMMTAFVYPRLLAFSMRNMSDAFGDFARWETAPVPLVLASYKIVLMAPPFSEISSYVYNSHSMTHIRSRDGFLADRQRFAAASFDSFSVLVGGMMVQSSEVTDELVHVQWPCGRAVREETCTMDPSARVLTKHPRGALHSTCAANLGNGIMFIHGGVNAFGRVVADTSLYNMTSDQWVSVDAGPQSRARHTCTPWTLGAQQCVVVVGGLGGDGTAASTASTFCIGQGWRTTNGFARKVLDPCTFASENRFYLFGGQTDNDDSLWTLSSDTLSWVSTTVSLSTGSHSVLLPRGGMRCVMIHDLGGKPYNQTVSGKADPTRVNSFHRVFMFGLGANGETSTSRFSLMTLPWVTCCAISGVVLSPNGLECVRPQPPSSTSLLAGELIAVIVVVIMAFIIAGLGACVARYVRAQREQQRKERRKKLLPKGNRLATAAVVLQPQKVSRDQDTARLLDLMGGLRAIAMRHKIYESQCFGSGLTYASDHPDRLVRMVLEQFDMIHNQAVVVGTDHSYTLCAAMFLGKVKKHVGAMDKVVYTGEASRALASMIRLCPIGEIVCSDSMQERINKGLLSDCHVSDPVEVKGIKFAYVRPKVSAHVRSAAITSHAPAKEPDTPSPRIHSSASSKAGKAGVDGLGPKSMRAIRMELCVLLLGEIFRQIAPSKDDKHKHAEDGQELVHLLYQRLDITVRTIVVKNQQKKFRKAGQVLRHKVVAVCNAIAREIEVVLVALPHARSDTATTNPFNSTALTSSAMREETEEGEENERTE